MNKVKLANKFIRTQMDLQTIRVLLLNIVGARVYITNKDLDLFLMGLLKHYVLEKKQKISNEITLKYIYIYILEAF